MGSTCPVGPTLTYFYRSVYLMAFVTFSRIAPNSSRPREYWVLTVSCSAARGSQPTASPTALRLSRFLSLQRHSRVTTNCRVTVMVGSRDPPIRFMQNRKHHHLASLNELLISLISLVIHNCPNLWYSNVTIIMKVASSHLLMVCELRHS